MQTRRLGTSIMRTRTLEPGPPGGLNPLRGRISRARTSYDRHPNPEHINEMPDSLAPALCRTATRTDKKELGIDVGGALAYVFTDTIAVTPPLFRIIIRVGG